MNADVSNNSPPVWLIVFIPFIAIGCFGMFWVFVVWMSSWLSGWRRLAKLYGGHAPPQGKVWPGLSGNIGLISYRGSLCAVTNEDGMFLRPGHLFGFGHEPIFIPWCEFYQARRKKFLLSNLVSVNIGSPKVAEITLAAQVFEQSEGAKVLN